MLLTPKIRMKKASILLVIFILAIPGCKRILKTPYIVSWDKNQVEMDLSCNARWIDLETCKSKFSNEKALTLANKYCGISKLTAHPEYYWKCADTSSSTHCSTRTEPSYNPNPRIQNEEKSYTTCSTSNHCSDYHLIYNCIEPSYD